LGATYFLGGVVPEPHAASSPASPDSGRKPRLRVSKASGDGVLGVTSLKALLKNLWLSSLLPRGRRAAPNYASCRPHFGMLAGVCCSRSRRLGPLLYRCFAAGSVLTPSSDAFAVLMVLLLGRLLRRWCRLGPLACRCFAAARVLAPSADALPC
jgi:hypothetical protein